ncbi:hypothetical protein [Streptomyces mangrovisoli]|uniref:Lipoprotein n=1 Tax=Streptomyces mangrovisoli TaxID=1428628 RepID=A0A1J4NW28_9ACTN|nr:hypothetical protein [Streptomyces mangrovisoli]OIJ65716.1 hypothetical protein WN71_022315 [Streptomyces mangrovisoli]
MRGGRGAGVRRALPVLLCALLAGCEGSSAGDGDGQLGGARPSSAAQASPGYGARFLAVDECSSFGTTSFTEVPCTSERAAARVVARYDGAASGGPACSATTDFVLHINAQDPTPGDGGAIPRGYACMRNLEPPHPGDPGQGGGPRTIVGDCVRGDGKDRVRETACAATGKEKPQFKVVEAVRKRSSCPASTALYVQLGGAVPVGCARRV